MKVELNNIGILRYAEFEVGDLTVICGKNNTGKTYAVYALYGFLKLWRSIIRVKPLRKHCENVVNNGVTRIELMEYYNNIENLLDEAGDKYSRLLYRVFASSEKLFADSEVRFNVDKKNVDLTKKFNAVKSSKKKELIIFSKDANSTILEVTATQGIEGVSLPYRAVEEFINEVILRIIFTPLFPDTFIASAERTGAAIFRKELDFARNLLLEEIGKDKDINPFDLYAKVYSTYALPVKDNVDFTRGLEEISKNDSYLSKEHPEILADFQEIIGGEYRIVRKELCFVPDKGNVRLKMNESSSSVRSLLDVGFYLKHMVEKGDILIIDEPELNLHPENQRRVARMFARLVNVGIKVFVTTHSDYIVKELNTLIMLNYKKEKSKKVIKEYKYSEMELLSVEKVRVYNSGKSSLKPPGAAKKSNIFTFVLSTIDPEFGIEIKSFDDSINEMNMIQEEILFEGDEE